MNYFMHAVNLYSGFGELRDNISMNNGSRPFSTFSHTGLLQSLLKTTNDLFIYTTNRFLDSVLRNWILCNFILLKHELNP
jgi:hypothetical protein